MPPAWTLLFDQSEVGLRLDAPDAADVAKTNGMSTGPNWPAMTFRSAARFESRCCPPGRPDGGTIEAALAWGDSHSVTSPRDEGAVVHPPIPHPIVRLVRGMHSRRHCTIMPPPPADMPAAPTAAPPRDVPGHAPTPDVDAARILVLTAEFRIRTKNGSPVGFEACLCLIARSASLLAVMSCDLFLR